MKDVAETLHLQKRGGVWYYFRRVPKALVAAIGKQFIKQSLGTSSLAEAKRLRTIHDLNSDALKKGCSPTYRAYQRRIELQAAHRLRRRRPACRHAAVGRPDERPQRRPSGARGPAAGQVPHRRSRLRQHLVSGGAHRQRHRAEAGKFPIPTTRRSIADATRSRTCSPSSRTGDVSQPATIDPLTLSSQQSAPLLPSSSGFETMSPEPRSSPKPCSSKSRMNSALVQHFSRTSSARQKVIQRN